MRQRQSAREQRGPLRQPQVTKARWYWGRVGYERAERPSEKKRVAREERLAMSVRAIWPSLP